MSHPDNGWYGPGCSEPGDGLSVPLLDGRHDVASVVRCIRPARTAGRSALSIAAAAHIPTQLLISTVDAVLADVQAEQPVSAWKLLVPVDRDWWSDANQTASVEKTPGYSDATTTVARMRGGFRECYNQQLAVDATAAGSVRLAIRVAPDGSVSGVSASALGNLGNVPECMKQVASAAHFAPPVGGSAVINIPVTFVRQNESGERRRSVARSPVGPCPFAPARLVR